MRLADFILSNIEPILTEWEAFARSVWLSQEVQPRELRDHAQDILYAVVRDMKSPQSATQQTDKSKGMGKGAESLQAASDFHGLGRVASGVSLLVVVSEYRALRASVLRLWRDSNPSPDIHDIDDITRFNESIDESLAKAVRSYTEEIGRLRQISLGILGHDLRNPLNAMMLSARVLAQTPELSTESSRIVSQISAGGSVMGRMISDLLDYTGTSLGKTIPISPAAMDLDILCKQVIEEARASNPTNTFRYEPRGDLTGEWDAERLRQVISNLLINAVQHGTGPVDLSVVGEDGRVRLAVRNEGAPIPEEILPTIFDPLVRASSPESATRRPGSLGLGLYIAREVVNAHGGTIDVKSSAEAGTIFTVSLPRHTASRPL